MGLTAANLSGLGAQASGAHRHNDTANGAAVYAIANQFNREQMIQRSSMQPYVRTASINRLIRIDDLIRFNFRCRKFDHYIFNFQKRIQFLLY